jgi:hypothetical protein
MTKSIARRSALDRQRSLLKAWQPVVARLRELVAGGYMSASVKRAFTRLKLDPNSENDWKVLTVLLADHLFDQGKKRGRSPWSEVQQIRLLSAVHQRKQNNPRLSDEQICKRLAKDKNSPPYFRVGLRGAEGSGQGLVKQLREARRQFQSNPLARLGFPLAFGRN